MRIKIYLTLLLITITTVAELAATTLPENYPLTNAPQAPNRIDPSLAKWFQSHAETSSPLELKSDDFKKYLKLQDSTTRAFLNLRYHNTDGDNPEPKALESALAEIAKLDNDDHSFLSAHPLVPYLLEEIIQTPTLKADKLPEITQTLKAYGGQSCPHKDLILREVSEGFDKEAKTAALLSILKRIGQFKSERFVNEALEAFLDSLPQEHHAALRKPLLAYARAHKKLLDDNQWLLEGEDTDDLQQSEPHKSFDSAEKNAMRSRCTTAKNELIKTLKLDGTENFFEDVKQLAQKIESCVRRRGSKARLRFWQQLTAPMDQTFGFRGRAFAERKIALLKWSADDFEEARKGFIKILKEAKKQNLKDIAANALFTLGRIEENDSQFTKSLDYYREYTQKYPDDENYLEAEIAMVLLNSIKGNLKDALANIDEIIQSQSELPVDQRSARALSFALFWAGRLHLNLGNKDLAIVMWHRAASEYYSTFYGALGHYMLEKTIGKMKELAPIRSQKFSAAAFYAKFPRDQQRVIERVEWLLRLGLKDEASCELSELDASDGANEKVLVKALLQNAAGDWLSSIKNFDSLPRSFRHGLPNGFERILFPRGYVNSVENYAARLGVDSDFVFAIIRQESVFNPRARSHAGARGLMQLMPATARVEARRLSRNYLPYRTRRKLRRSVRRRSSLFDAETNLALGVHHVHRLMKQFQNPILVLTSYNANPNATKRWIANIPTEDYLIFIERIPYRETQTYVKLVLRNYFYYKRWYKGPAKHIPHLEDIASNVIVLAKKEQK